MARYFNKAAKTEHVPALHGDPAGLPHVVELPPENTFWGEPMEPDEELTFDAEGLPLARVKIPVPPETALRDALLAAGITRAAMDKAVYLAGRGVPGPLTVLDNDLDALVLSEGVSLETLVALI
jgi:hypothetical protein